MGAAEIRRALGGVSETRGRQITGRSDFPPPLADLEMGKVWWADAVEAWIAAHRRPVAEPTEGEPDAG